MGTFTIPIEVGDLDGHRFEDLDALVDTGASYLAVPRAVLESLDVPVTEQRLFAMADGRKELFDLGDVLLRLDGRAHPVITVFGKEGTRALLGAVPLETFGLQVDPYHKRLVPMTGLLMPIVGQRTQKDAIRG